MHRWVSRRLGLSGATRKHRTRYRFWISYLVDQDSGNRYRFPVNNAHRKVLITIYSRPTRSDIRWSDVEALVVTLGGTVDPKREGSRVALSLNDVRAIFHRPHPQPTAKKGAVDAVRVFLTNAGVKP